MCLHVTQLCSAAFDITGRCERDGPSHDCGQADSRVHSLQRGNGAIAPDAATFELLRGLPSAARSYGQRTWQKHGTRRQTVVCQGGRAPGICTARQQQQTSA